MAESSCGIMGLVKPDPEILTPRLSLRRWYFKDLESFAELNADAKVMEYFPKLLNREESDAQAGRIQQHFNEHGFGLWAVEIPGRSEFAGLLGLNIPRFTARFTPCVEIGWRMSPENWGQGFATEGALAVLKYAFESLGLPEIVAMTAQCNRRSRRVMERIAMRYNPDDDFDHPLIEPDHWLARHVLYRIENPRLAGGRQTD